MITLKRRGFSLGTTQTNTQQANDSLEHWHQGKPTLLRKALFDELEHHQNAIKQTETLIKAILDNQECDAHLANAPYSDRLEPKFESLGSAYNEAV